MKTIPINWRGIHRQHRQDLFTISGYREILVTADRDYSTAWTLTMGSPIIVNLTAEEVGQLMGGN